MFTFQTADFATIEVPQFWTENEDDVRMLTPFFRYFNALILDRPILDRMCQAELCIARATLIAVPL